MSSAWSLTDAQRAETVRRVRANMATLSFFRDAGLTESELDDLSVRLEDKAYASAQVESRTTTGFRPAIEVTRAYARRLGQLVLEAISHSAAKKEASIEAASAGGMDVDDGSVLDLSAEGGREFLTAVGAREALARALASDSKIVRIKLSTRSFGVEAAEVAAEAIRTISGTLQVADLSDVVAGRPEDEALSALRIMAEALSECPELRELDLSDNALGEKGLRAAAASLRCPKLQTLRLRNVGCSTHACRALAELLPAPQQLVELELANNMTGDDGALALASLLGKARRLERLTVVSSRVGAEGGIALSEALVAAGAPLRFIDLHDNPLSIAASDALSSLLEAARASLETVRLDDVGVEDSGAAALARALAGAERLAELRLSLNEAAAEAAEALEETLPTLGALETLEIRESELGDDGARAVARGLAALRRLRALDASANELSGTGSIALVRAALKSPELASLKLDENEIQLDALAAAQSLFRAAGFSDEAVDAILSFEDNDDDANEGEDWKADDEGLADELAAALGKMGM